MNIGKALRLFKVEPIKVPVPRKTRDTEPASPVAKQPEEQVAVRR